MEDVDRNALERLEGMVQEASVELRKLRLENEHLKEMMERSGNAPTEAAPSWGKEREQLRRRVERLAEQLQSLLQE